LAAPVLGPYSVGGSSQKLTVTPLDDGKYAAVVTNVLGQAATGYFDYDATEPQVSAINVQLGSFAGVQIPNPPPLGIHKEGAPGALIAPSADREEVTPFRPA